MSIGFMLPFSKTSSSTGYFEMTKNELSAVVQNMRSLILTNWGDRVMHHSMGCNLIEFLFDNDGADDVRLKIIDRISSQISTWMPFVVIDKIVVLFHEDDPLVPEHTIGLRIRFGISGKPDMSGLLDIDYGA